MLQPSNNLSVLFRSLGPDEGSLEAATKAAAPRVEQVWPLFKAVAPATPEHTPPLSAQEKELWSMQDVVKVEAPRPALSMSGLSSKLAHSLSQLSEQIAAQAAPRAVSAPGDQPLAALPSPSAPVNVPEAMPNAHVSLFAKPLAAAEPQGSEEKGNVVGLFEKSAVQPIAIQNPAPGSAGASGSLTHLFSRLEAKEQVIVRPLEKRSSLSSRLGKR